MDETVPPGWPGDDAARDGAPLETGYGATDARLIAAERVIAQLRSLLGALVADSGGDELAVPTSHLADRRVRQLRIVADHDQVRLLLPSGEKESYPPETDAHALCARDEPTETAAMGPVVGEPGDEPRDEPVEAQGEPASPGGTRLMHRLAQVIADHTHGGVNHAPDTAETPAPSRSSSPDSRGPEDPGEA